MNSFNNPTCLLEQQTMQWTWLERVDGVAEVPTSFKKHQSDCSKHQWVKIRWEKPDQERVIIEGQSFLAPCWESVITVFLSPS